MTVLGNTGTLAKTGYTFDGWNTAANGSGTNRAAASTFTMGPAGVTLYAKWTVSAPSTEVILNAANSKTCNTVCSEHAYSRCLSVGDDTGGTNGKVWSNFDGDCFEQPSATCSFVVGDGFISCSGHRSDWTNCLCSN